MDLWRFRVLKVAVNLRRRNTCNLLHALDRRFPTRWTGASLAIPRPGHLSPTTITALKAGVGVRRGVSRGALGVLG